MYDYDATGSDEISFKAGDKIKVLNRIPNGVDDGWWKGMVKSTGKVGLFPSIICEPLEESDSDEEDLPIKKADSEPARKSSRANKGRNTRLERGDEVVDIPQVKVQL